MTAAASGAPGLPCCPMSPPPFWMLRGFSGRRKGPAPPRSRCWSGGSGSWAVRIPAIRPACPALAQQAGFPADCGPTSARSLSPGPGPFWMPWTSTGAWRPPTPSSSARGGSILRPARARSSRPSWNGCRNPGVASRWSRWWGPWPKTLDRMQGTSPRSSWRQTPRRCLRRDGRLRVIPPPGPGGTAGGGGFLAGVTPRQETGRRSVSSCAPPWREAAPPRPHRSPAASARWAR